MRQGQGGPVSERARLELELEGGDWVLFDAGRSENGLGLGYFARRDGRGWAPPEEDRRAALEPGSSVEEMSEDEARELLASAARLTATERRVIDADGRLWLVQGVGPVWSDRESAAGTIGVRARCVEADTQVVRAAGRAPADYTEAELVDLLADRPAEGLQPDQ